MSWAVAYAGAFLYEFSIIVVPREMLHTIGPLIIAVTDGVWVDLWESVCVTDSPLYPIEVDGGTLYLCFPLTH